MRRESFRQTVEKTRRDALKARDRFYTEAAGGDVPTDVHVELAAAVMRLHNVAKLFTPLDGGDELPDVSAVSERYFESTEVVTKSPGRSGGREVKHVSAAVEVEAAELVELIDELDRIARKYGAGGVGL